MQKYLRYLAASYATGTGWQNCRPLGPDVSIPEAETSHLCWMYEREALPLRIDGVSKLNVYFTVDSNSAAAEIDPLGIGSVWEEFSLPHYLSLSPRDRQRYYLERLHLAVSRTVRQLGGATEPLLAACQRIIEAEFHLSFFWKRPLASPDRKLTVQPFVDVQEASRIYLVFTTARKQEAARVLFSMAGIGPGCVEAVLGSISWHDRQTIKVTMSNGRDYWLCTVDGDVEFHYPRAERDAPHGMYDLGRMYYDGVYVLPDRVRGLALIRASAAAGFKHAIRFLSCLGD